MPAGPRLHSCGVTLGTYTTVVPFHPLHPGHAAIPWTKCCHPVHPIYRGMYKPSLCGWYSPSTGGASVVVTDSSVRLGLQWGSWGPQAKTAPITVFVTYPGMWYFMSQLCFCWLKRKCRSPCLTSICTSCLPWKILIAMLENQSGKMLGQVAGCSLLHFLH